MLDSMKPNLLELETDYEEERIPANPTVISDYQQGRTSTATLSAMCSCSLSVCRLSNMQHYWCFHAYTVFSHEVMPCLYTQWFSVFHLHPLCYSDISVS